MQLDMKTLYEQITMYFEKIDVLIGADFFAEVYQQKDTPIIAQVFFARGSAVIKAISFVVKEAENTTSSSKKVVDKPHNSNYN